MITSSSIQYISQVLTEPQNISDADAESIAALIEAYPYFIPARYMDAANKHKKAPYNSAMMADMQLYANNWLMYCNYLQASLNGQEETIVAEIAQPIIAEEKAAEIVIDVAEEKIPEITADNTKEEVIEELQIAAEEAVVEAQEEAIATPEIEPEVIVAEQKEAFVEPAPQTIPEPLYTQKKTSKEDEFNPETDESFILPVYTEDYFLHQGMHVSNKIPEDLPGKVLSPAEEAKALMVVMSFAEWLLHFKTRKEKEQEEVEGQKAVKTMWQKEKLAAALEEENEEIPEKVFEMAVNSITKEDDLVSESLAEVHAMQGRYDKSIEMYRKLSLRNPQKKAYFARKIEMILKDKQT